MSRPLTYNLENAMPWLAQCYKAVSPSTNGVFAQEPAEGAGFNDFSLPVKGVVPTFTTNRF